MLDEDEICIQEGSPMKCDFCSESMLEDETGLFLIDEQCGGHIKCGLIRLEELQRTTLFKNKKPTIAHLDTYDEW